MAVGLPQLLYSGTIGSTDTITSSAITPTPGRILVAIASARRGASTASDPFTISGGVTWDPATESFAQNGTTSPSMRQAMWSAIVPSGLSPFTVTAQSVNASHVTLIIFEVDQGKFTAGQANSIGSNVGDPVVTDTPAYQELIIYSAAFAGVPTLTANPGANELIRVTGTNSLTLVTYDTAASGVGTATWASTGTRSVGSMMEIRSALADASLSVGMSLDAAFSPTIVSGQALAADISLSFSFTAVNTSSASPENPAGVWRAATRTWDMPAGIEPIAGNNLTFG